METLNGGLERKQRIKLRGKIVEEMKTGLAAGDNPLFSLPPKYKEYGIRCEEQGLEAKGADLSLGDMSAKSLEREPDFRGLAAEFGLNPDSEQYRQIHLYGESLYRQYWYGPKELTGYQAATGVPEVRAGLADFFNRWTGLEIRPEDSLTVIGGGSEAARVTLKGLRHLREEKQQKPVLLTAAPYYRPIIDMAIEEGFAVVAIPCTESNNFFFQPDQVVAAIKKYGTTDFYAPTVGNPHGIMIPEQQLTEVAAAALQVNSEMFFILDTVYNCNLGRERSASQLAGLSDAGQLDRIAFIHSLSKSHWYPGGRYGCLFAVNQELKSYIVRAITVGNPSQAVASQLELYGILQVVKDETINRGAEVLARRREAGLGLLRLVNQAIGREVFREPTIKPDGGLYLYPELGETMPGAFEVFKQLGLFMAPGLSFGEPQDSRRVRLAFGRHSSREILTIVEGLDLIK